MSAGQQLSPVAAPAVSPSQPDLLGHLLHALNQPLTGLQCLLELAVAGPRRAERYFTSLQQGLELTARIRLLVEALREAAEMNAARRSDPEPLRLDCAFAEVARDLLPVAAAKEICLQFRCAVPLTVCADLAELRGVVFRFLESALSLTPPGGFLRIAATGENQRARLLISWSASPTPEYSPFSRSELGLLIAQAGWKKAGGDSSFTHNPETHAYNLSFPLCLQASSPDRGEVR